MWGGLVGGGVPLGRAGRAPGTHVLLILRIERVHHILRGFGIVAPSSRPSTAYALAFCIDISQRGRAQLGGLSMQGPPAFHRRFQARLDAGTREFRGSDAAPDSFTSFKRSATAWDRDAGVVRSRLGTCEGRKKGHGSVQHPADREPGTRGWRARATRSDARGRARRDRCFAEVVLRFGIPSVGAQVARANPRGRVVSVGDARIFSSNLPSRRRLARTWLLPSNRPTHARATLSRVSRGERRRLRVYTPRRGPLLDRRRRLWLGGGRFRAIRR